MKKLLAICLTVLTVASLSFTAFAVTMNFIPSPSADDIPRIESFIPDDDDCTADLKLTPYVYRDTLSDADKTLMDKAYESILNADSILDLNDELDESVRGKRINVDTLDIGDLFDLTCDGCETHFDHSGFKVILGVDYLDKFAGLIQMLPDGEWAYVSNARVINGGKSLEFHIDELSTPFAIVIGTADSVASQTGDNLIIYAGVFFAAAVALSVGIIVSNKKSNKKNKA